MKKRISIILLLILSLFVLGGCQASQRQGTDNQGGQSSTILLPDSARKIIYTVDARIKSDDYIEVSNKIKSKLVAGEDWVESEINYNNAIGIVLRVKTSRLNDFLESIKTDYSPESLQIKSKDVSLDYFDIEARKASLEASIARLNALKESASVSEIIEIEKQIVEYQEELNKLNRDLTVYDSLIEYSKVELYIYGRKADPEPPYFKTLSNSFKNGWQALVTILKFILQAVVTTLPFVLVAAPVVGIILAIVYHKKIKEYFKKKKEAKSKEELDNNEEITESKEEETNQDKTDQN